MQNFPTVYHDTSVSALGGVGVKTVSSPSEETSEYERHKKFLDSFNRELAESGYAPIVDTSLQTSLPKGFRTVKRDMSVRLDDEDIGNIVASLRKRGVSESAVSGIEALMGSNVPPTIGNIRASVTREGRLTEHLGEDELKSLESALSKLGLSPGEVDDIKAMMEEGEGKQALKAITAALDQLGKGTVSLERGELKALMRGLDLTDKTMARMLAAFGQGQSADLDASAFGKLLSPATEQFAEQELGREAVLAELKTAIDDALQAKKIRERTEPVSDARGSKRSERAELRMRDDLTARANGLGRDGMRDSLERMEEEEAQLAEQEQSRRHREDRTPERTAERGKVLVENRAEKSADKQDQPLSEARQGFNTIIDRVDAAPGQTFTSQQGNQNQQPGQQAPQQPAYAARQEIFAQVQQGIVRQLADGAHQMTLRLDPTELGQLSLLLTAKDGEVRATIRADSPETAATLTEQMSQIRASLEEQGLKVAELNIETQLPHDTTSGQWTDMTFYNQEQEMREQARFLRLAKLRRESGSDLARNVQETRRQLAPETGLHIIA